MINIEEVNSNLVRVIENADAEGAFLQDFLGSPAGDATFEVVQADGTTVTNTVPNIAKFTGDVADTIADHLTQVFYVSKIGSDSSDGLTEGTAFLTLAKAANSVNDFGMGKIYVTPHANAYELDSKINMNGKTLLFEDKTLTAPYVTFKSVTADIASDISGGFSGGIYTGTPSSLTFRNIFLETNDDAAIDHTAYTSHLIYAPYCDMSVTIDNLSLRALDVPTLTLNKCSFSVAYPGLSHINLHTRALNLTRGVGESSVLISVKGTASIDLANLTIPLGTTPADFVSSVMAYNADMPPHNIISNIDLTA